MTGFYFITWIADDISFLLTLIRGTGVAILFSAIDCRPVLATSEFFIGLKDGTERRPEFIVKFSS